ncbi:hypothetical protein L218DRAFT_958828 [Marasmius fiardii PR-910]|nr:hypothetical protein L218DRAFT_958828 [Marasmius fiardii PR-910]
MNYPLIPGTSRIPPSSIAPPILQNDPLPPALTSPNLPEVGSKSIFAFWHSGISTLPPYLLRSVIAWYRRYSPLGWTIYVLDRVEGSPLNVSRFIDTTSPLIVPAAFINSQLEGAYVGQHTSDLVRYPLLLKYGGVYLDVGILQFGDLNWLWEQVISNPESPYDYAGFTMSVPPEISIVNFAMMCGPNNPLVSRAHKILLKLWEGKTTTTGMHKHPLVRHVPLMVVPKEILLEDDGGGSTVVNDSVMTDYAIQIQAMGAAQRWLDVEDGWDGPKYVREKTWLLSMMENAFMHDQMTGWSGKRQFELLSLKMSDSKGETEEQRLARELVEKTVGGSWCLKLAHGISGKLFGDTLGMLWKRHVGTDCAEGTCAEWMRWAEVSCKQDKPTKPLEIPVYKPTMIGKLADYL